MKKTFNIFHLLFDERKKTFSFVLNLEKSFLSLLSFCREKKILLSFPFTKMKVFFLSRVKVFFRAHPWSQLTKLRSYGPSQLHRTTLILGSKRHTFICLRLTESKTVKVIAKPIKIKAWFILTTSCVSDLCTFFSV